MQLAHAEPLRSARFARYTPLVGGGVGRGLPPVGNARQAKARQGNAFPRAHGKAAAPAKAGTAAAHGRALKPYLKKRTNRNSVRRLRRVFPFYGQESAPRYARIFRRKMR